MHEKQNMIEHGTITSVENGLAVIEIDENPQCENCRICTGSAGKKKMAVELPPNSTFAAGQQVEIEISSGQTLKGGFMVFIAPLIAYIIGALLGRKIFDAAGIEIEPNLAAIIFGFILSAIALAAATFMYRSEKRKQKLKPHIVIR